MSRFRALSLCAAALLLGARPLLSQARPATSVAYGARSAAAAAAMLPMTTLSAAARQHATLGQRALDFGHPVEAAQHFDEALAADSGFAFAWFGKANASTSVQDFARALKTAREHGAKANRAEQLQIEIASKQLEGNLEEAAALARELTTVAPRNPRSYLTLAGTQNALGKEAAARQSMQRAISIAPRFAPAYLQLAYSYILNAPRAPKMAEAPTRKAISLEPKESLPYIVSGSFHRAMNQLELARLAYTRAATVDQNNALPLQQRGHVNTFLGDYDAARADYDAAIRIGRQNEPATYAIYRALVPVYAGEPREAITEFEQILTRLDSMNVPDPAGAKVFALTSEALIAVHTGAFDEAQRAIERRSELLRAQATQVGADEFRRAQEADIAYWEGLLAARRGDSATALAKAQEVMRIVAPDKNPRKNEPAHTLMGMVALEQKKYAEAATHLAQGNPNDMYVQYHRALALEGAGRTAEAKKLFGEIARFNFSTAAAALVRAEAKKRAAT